MKKGCIVLLCFFAGIQFLSAQKIDYDFLKKITGTKWELASEKNYSRLFPKKVKQPVKETITFSNGSILFDLSDEHYACNFTVKNSVEYWMYCTEPDQYIYKIHALSRNKLVIDVSVKDRKGNYSHKKRQVFTATR